MGFSATILQVIPALEAGGAERTTVEITEAVTAAGGRALVATTGGRMAGEIEAAGGRLILLPVKAKNPIIMAQNAIRLAGVIEREAVDLVHARSRAPAWSALWAARRTGRPLVTTYHGAYKAGSPLKRLYNSSMVRGDAVIANSRFTASQIAAQYEIAPGRLRVIPRGADINRFTPAAVSPERMDALVGRWGLAERPGGLKILMPARLTSWKGHVEAVRAIAQLANGAAGNAPPGDASQARDLQLVFAGDAQERGDFVERLRGEVERLGVRDMVYFVGDCADMPAAYAWCDIVLSPSTRPEAFGRVAVEAGAMGRPVIAADHGGARETVVDRITGVLVPPADTEALADAICELAAAGADGRRRMGERARERVEQLYSSEALKRATLNVYQSLLS